MLGQGHKDFYACWKDPLGQERSISPFHVSQAEGEARGPHSELRSFETLLSLALQSVSFLIFLSLKLFNEEEERHFPQC